MIRRRLSLVLALVVALGPSALAEPLRTGQPSFKIPSVIAPSLPLSAPVSAPVWHPVNAAAALFPAVAHQLHAIAQANFSNESSVHGLENAFRLLEGGSAQDSPGSGVAGADGASAGSTLVQVVNEQTLRASYQDVLALRDAVWAGRARPEDFYGQARAVFERRFGPEYGARVREFLGRLAAPPLPQGPEPSFASMSAQDRSAFFAQMPKGAELHVHLNGAIAPEVWIEIAEQLHARLPAKDVAALLRHAGEDAAADLLDPSRAAISIHEMGPELRAAIKRALVTGKNDKSLQDFLAKWLVIAPLSKPEAHYAMLKHLAEQAKKQGVLYLETMVSSEAPVLEAAAKDAKRVEQETGVVIRLMGVAGWYLPPKLVEGGIRDTQRFAGAGAVGFNMVADELKFRPLLHYESFKPFRENPSRIKISLHAGEQPGTADNMVNDLLLGVERYGHATQVEEDPLAMALLYASKTPVEVSLLSNQQTGVMRDLSRHPLPRMLAWGVPVALSTDDPGIFQSTLGQEYDLAQKQFGLSWAQLKEISRNGLRHSFLDEGTRADLLKRLEERFAEFERSGVFHRGAPLTLEDYEARRGDLALISERTGILASLPAASPALAATLVELAADKQVVFSDYDDTLDGHAAVASPETVAAILSVKNAGKQMVIVTDRPDIAADGSHPKESILFSLSSIPPASRAGIIVAANKGGRILRYDAAGEPELIYEEPAMSDADKAKVRAAAEVVKAQLASMGTALHDGSRNIPAESLHAYSYAMMLKPGTPEAAVRRVAEALGSALAAQGLSERVVPRLSKDPLNPPYVVFFRLDKSLATRRVSELLKLKAEDALILGDSMFRPAWSKPEQIAPEVAAAAARAGLDLSVPPATLLGNDVDRDMERGLAGALALGVGGSADPTMRNGFVMPGKGPSVTRLILNAVGSRPARPAQPSGEGADLGNPVDGRFSYGLRRALLAAIYRAVGVKFSLPVTGPKLKRWVLGQAARRRVVVSDFDDTLGPNSTILSDRMAARIVAQKKAGKKIIIVTARRSLGVTGKGMTIMDSLSSIEPEDQEGIVVATKQDGYVGRFGKNGLLYPVYRFDGFAQSEIQALLEASAAAGLPDSVIKVAQPQSFSVLFAAGTPQPAVSAAAARFQRELDRRGLRYRAEPRAIKDPALQPYIAIDKLNKADLMRKVAELEGLKPEDVVIWGDSMYAPEDGGSLGRVGRLLARLARHLSGRDLPPGGNDSDRDMEAALPGALTISVGGTADPTMRNAFVVDGGALGAEASSKGVGAGGVLSLVLWALALLGTIAFVPVLILIRLYFL